MSNGRASIEPLEVVVYRGMGGGSIDICNCITVQEMLRRVDELTDWMWGVGEAYQIVDMDTGAKVRRNARLYGAKHRFQILYETRVSSVGFPCYYCWRFVSWQESKWFTRFNPFQWEEPGADTKKNRRALYSPRDYLCCDCGDFLEGRQLRYVEEVRYDQESRLYHYTSLWYV